MAWNDTNPGAEELLERAMGLLCNAEPSRCMGEFNQRAWQDIKDKWVELYIDRDCRRALIWKWTKFLLISAGVFVLFALVVVLNMLIAGCHG